MPDFAVSTDPAVQAQLDRLVTLSPGADVLGLERITRLLGRLGDPHLRLPPVFHVAGTNGKGSTCAFLRAAMEAAGLRVHVYASPHLVRFNERIRLAGTLIGDAALAALLAEVLDVAEGIGASFFEITTAAAFLAFSRVRADACVIEVGLGGRLDATNVLPAPVMCGIAALGIDHEAFLGSSPTGIAGEKAGIAKPGVPVATLAYPDTLAARVAETVTAAGGSLVARGAAWDAIDGRYRDARGTIDLPEPALSGAHQRDNLALATAMLRHQSAVTVPDEAIVAGAKAARWPARMQRLRPGPLIGRVDPRHGVWLDGAHNEIGSGRDREGVAADQPGRAVGTGAGDAGQQGCRRGADAPGAGDRPCRRGAGAGACASRPGGAGADGADAGAVRRCRDRSGGGAGHARTVGAGSGADRGVAVSGRHGAGGE